MSVFYECTCFCSMCRLELATESMIEDQGLICMRCFRARHAPTVDGSTEVGHDSDYVDEDMFCSVRGTEASESGLFAELADGSLLCSCCVKPRLPQKQEHTKSLSDDSKKYSGSREYGFWPVGGPHCGQCVQRAVTWFSSPTRRSCTGSRVRR